MQQQPRRRRHGALAVEAAVVYPVLFALLFGLIVGGVGVFRYQQVACLAREAARYATVHGSDWQTKSGNPPCQTQDLLDLVVLPFGAGMNSASVALQVQWIDGNTGNAFDWDTVSHTPSGTGPYGEPVNNRVRVTVTYTWMPEFLLTGPLLLTSTSEVPMSY
jgi:Flp pilus assembly protein TadG